MVMGERAGKGLTQKAIVWGRGGGGWASVPLVAGASSLPLPADFLHMLIAFSHHTSRGKSASKRNGEPVRWLSV